MKTPLIGFAGMTHLGLNSAVATAERGFQVIAFDENQELIQRLQHQDCPIVEPLLSELLIKNAERLTFTARVQDLLTCDVVYIATDVPTNDKGQSDLNEISILINTVSENLNQKAILVILCQVPPGFTRALTFPAERLYYQVETLIFGRAIERALYPERFIIGCAKSEVPLAPAYRMLLEKFECPILPMLYESAELTKIAINCCLVATIGVANTLSEICEKIGANWSEVVPALKLDKRIGEFAYLIPGLGISGGNLERDLTTILELSKEYGTEAGIVSAWVKNSEYRRDWVLKMLHMTVLAKTVDPVIGVLGLAYKEGTDSIKNSPALVLLQSLSSYRVKVYDPVVPATVVPTVEGANSVEEVVKEVDALVIMTPWATFKDLKPKDFKSKMRGQVIIDPYRVLNGEIIQKEGFTYLTLGMNTVC